MMKNTGVKKPSEYCRMMKGMKKPENCSSATAMDKGYTVVGMPKK